MHRSENSTVYSSTVNLETSMSAVTSTGSGTKPKRRSFSVIKRKRDTSDDDNISVLSFDVSVLSQEGRARIRRKLSKVASFITPSLSKRKKISSALDEHSPDQSHLVSEDSPKPTVDIVTDTASADISVCNASSVLTPPLRCHSSFHTPNRRRSSRLWLESLPKPVFQRIKETLSKQEIQRQEAIFELHQGEEDLVDDLNLIQKIYHDSLLRLGILKPEELKQIFGPFHELVPVHQDLLGKWKNLKCEDGQIEVIGEILKEWVPGLRKYVSYCANQTISRALLDIKKSHDPRLNDFLQRCLESPFSRRLDLWTFLDVPRSRLVKYPLLLKRILKHTPDGHEDKILLPLVITQAEEIVKEVDMKTGEAKCQFVLKGLDFGFDENEKDSSFIMKAKTLLCSGLLRNSRGTKLHAFLFDTGFVLTRPITKWRSSSSGTSVAATIYHVYRDPIAAEQLEFSDLKDGEARIGGSFRNAFMSGSNSKNLLRVSSQNEAGPAYCLQANDEHDKKQWVQCLQQLCDAQDHAAESSANSDSTSKNEHHPVKKSASISTAIW